MSGTHRLVTDEPPIPFEATVLYEDAGIVVVDKPHFLATTPRGMWYRQTVLIRMREALGEPELTPAHRLDRLTAGIVVLVRDPALRGAYQRLFQERRVSKTYECLAPCAPVRPGPASVPSRASVAVGTVRRLEPPRPFPLLRRSRILKRPGILQAWEEPGTPNAETLIDRGPLVVPSSSRGGGLCRYTLHPRTGRTHQLRVHMASLGLPIEGDDLYPRVVERPYDDFSRPLRLVARRLAFVDPVDGTPREFVSRMPLE